jgi:hypothetical protein
MVATVTWLTAMEYLCHKWPLDMVGGSFFTDSTLVLHHDSDIKIFEEEFEDTKGVIRIHI